LIRFFLSKNPYLFQEWFLCDTVYVHARNIRSQISPFYDEQVQYRAYQAKKKRGYENDSPCDARLNGLLSQVWCLFPLFGPLCGYDVLS